jgi:nicotinamidase-related amidase
MKTALLIIDMQNDFILPHGAMPIPTVQAIVPDLQTLLTRFRQQGRPVIHVVREYRSDGCDVERFRVGPFMDRPCVVPGTTGAEIIDELKPVRGELRLVKHRFSAFMGTELDLILRRWGIEELVVAGVQYPNCIRATIFDAVALDYRVTIVSECVGAASADVARANIVDLKNIGVNFVDLVAYR